MRWLDWLFRRSPPRQHVIHADVLQPKHVITDEEQAYLSSKLAAVEMRTEALARVNRLGYEVDIMIRRDSDDAEY